MVFFSNHKHPSKPAADEAGGKDELPDEQKQAAEGLKAAVQTSGQPGAATSPAGGVLCPAKHAAKKHETGTHFWSAYIPGIEKYAAEVGNRKLFLILLVWRLTLHFRNMLGTMSLSTGLRARSSGKVCLYTFERV